MSAIFSFGKARTLQGDILFWWSSFFLKRNSNTKHYSDVCLFKRPNKACKSLTGICVSFVFLNLFPSFFLFNTSFASELLSFVLGIFINETSRQNRIFINERSLSPWADNEAQMEYVWRFHWNSQNLMNSGLYLQACRIRYCTWWLSDSKIKRIHCFVAL